MRASLLTSSLILVWNVVFGQPPENTIAFEDKEFNEYFLKRNVPVVRGKILNLTAEEIKQIKITYSLVTPFADLQATNHCELNADGSFELKLDYAFPYQQIWLRAGELFYTGIYANTELYIELDAQLLRTQENAVFNCSGVKYLGEDGALNMYMNNRVLYKREKQLEVNRVVSKLSKKRLDYLVKYDSLYAILDELDDEYVKQNPSEFSWMVKNERQSDYYGNLCVYHWGKQMPDELFEKVKNHKAYLVSNEGMLFYQYLFLYLETLPTNGKKTDDIISETLWTIKTLDSLFAPSKSDFLKIKFSSKDPNEHKMILETVLADVRSDWCKAVIQAGYAKIVGKLASINSVLEQSNSFVSNNNQLGQPISELRFDAKLYKVDTLDAKTLLSGIKNAFPNRALLIDVWATWCAPCIQEFPHSKKLRESTKDLPIEFVYLCTSHGSDIAKWQSKIAEFELSGTHIYVEKNTVSELMEMFSASGFPTYILLNTKGEYKPADWLRPSHLDREKLSELIE